MNNETPKVSIIIPVYNTEDYVKEAVESILNQTLHNIEVIAINDGSTDNSLRVLESIAERDARVKIISQQNKGLSITRNVGINVASGKYLYFMDSDDFLNKEALELCYLKCEREKLDFLFFDADILNKDSHLFVDINYSRHGSTDEGYIYKGIDIMNILVSNWAFTSSACLNFISSEYLNKLHLRFFPGIIHEDQLFTALLYINAERVMYINKAFFLRRFRDDSIMTRKFSWKNVIGYFTVTRELIKFRKNANAVTTEVIDRFLAQMLNAAIRQAYLLSLVERIKIVMICIFEFFKYIRPKTYIILLFKSLNRQFRA